MFADRTDAGRQLARLLAKYKRESPFVFGLPRGGIVVAFEVARELDAPLDVLVVRKLGAPINPEFGFGALAPGGVRYLNSDTVAMLRLTMQDIEEVVAVETRELERRMRAYRGDRPEPAIGGRTAILVDDGLATGGTARAAIRYIRRARPSRVVVAVPVAPPDTVWALREEVDEVICPQQPTAFRAIGEWYEEFSQTSDEEVARLLRANEEQRSVASDRKRS